MDFGRRNSKDSLILLEQDRSFTWKALNRFSLSLMVNSLAYPNCWTVVNAKVFCRANVHFGNFIDFESHLKFAVLPIEIC